MDLMASNSIDHHAQSQTQRARRLGKDFIEAGSIFLLSLALVGILFTAAVFIYLPQPVSS